MVYFLTIKINIKMYIRKQDAWIVLGLSYAKSIVTYAKATQEDYGQQGG